MYMRRYFYILLTLACLASCAEILPSGKEDGMGMVCMRMSVDVATRSDAGGGSILETAHVNIYKADFSGLVEADFFSPLLMIYPSLWMMRSPLAIVLWSV